MSEQAVAERSGQTSGMRAVVTTLAVLEKVAALQPVGVSELARETGIPKSSVQRCLVSLRTAGWLATTGPDTARWELTGKVRAVALQAANDLGLREAALPTMHDLRDQTAETVHLVARDGTHTVITERLDSPQPVRTWVRLGTLTPLHATSSGRSILAALPESEASRLLAGQLERYTTSTTVDRDRILAGLPEVRRRGYAVNDGGWRPGVGAVGAALINPAGDPVGAVVVSVPIHRFGEEVARRFGELVAAGARTISATLADLRE